MTAEVAIINSGAVALAADSAVTIGGQKIYNSAIKLFSLSKIAPVGIMIYGNANLMEVPWEILIKSYRRNLASKTFNYLNDYAEDFIKYLENHPSAFPKEVQTEWLKRNVRGFYTLIREELWEEIHPILQINGEISQSEILKIFSKIVKKQHKRLSDYDYSDGMSSDDFANIKEKYKEEFKKIRKEIFEKLKISAAIAALLNDIAAFLHVKQIFSSSVSGIVIAGYGEKQLYPSIITYEVEGVIENKLKYKKNNNKCHSIKHGTECAILAFAQEDMVDTFMSGINPSIMHLLNGYLKKLFDRLPEIVHQSKFKENELKQLKRDMNKLLKSFFKEFQEHVQKEHIHPVLRMVTSLPKDELAAMAEAFVNLTAFKRRITDSLETVGGPVDVAVISKGDGLVWVKRKHYFPADLNQHFFENYFREVNHEMYKK